MAETRTHINWNVIDFDRILHSPAVVALERAEAERLIQTINALAAAAPFEKRTGRYEESFRAETWHGPTRTAVRVVSSVPYAMKLERKYGILTRALATAGLD